MDYASLTNFYDNFQLIFDNIRSLPRKYNLVILGDLNSHYDNTNPHENTIAGRRLNSFLIGNNLTHLINEPTRITRYQATILDVFITNCPNIFTKVGTCSSPSICDHSFSFAQMNISIFEKRCFKRDIWDFRNVNTFDLNHALSLNDWGLLFDTAFDIDYIYDIWFKTVNDVVKRYIPLKSVVIRPRDKSWMNGEVRRAIRKRDRLLHIHNIRRSDSSWESYRRQRNFSTNLTRSAKQIYYDKLNKDLGNPKINSKKWWSITKSLWGSTNVSLVPTIIENDVPAAYPGEKANIFNDYFVAQGRLPGADTLLPSVQLHPSARDFLTIAVEEEEIFRLMKNVDVTKASGCDGFGNRTIKLCAEGLCSSFTKLVNRSFALGKYPSQWQLANVIPLYKKENRQLKINYRPVSLFPCLSKLCEKVVFKRLCDYLIEIGFLYRFQSGFRPGDSTVNQLLFLVHQIYLAFEHRKEVRVVYLDISKAFDRVWHRVWHRAYKIGIAWYWWFFTAMV